MNVTGFSITDDGLVTLSDGTNKKIKDIKAGEQVLTLDEKTGKLVPRKVNALLDHGIKPIYKMTTEDGRAINTTPEHPYLAKLYSKKECDKYANDVWNKEADEFDEYCTRWVEVIKLNVGDEIAVPKFDLNKVYSSGKSISANSGMFSKSAVENTSTLFCSFNKDSFDHKGSFNFIARDKKSTSFESGEKSKANFKNSLYSSNGINSTAMAKSPLSFLNSSSDIPVFFRISGTCALISSSANSGEYNSRLILIRNLLANELFQKYVYNMLVSTTSSTYINPFFFKSSSLPLLEARCSLTDQLVIFCSASSFALNSSSFANLSTFSSIDFLTNPDQFISGNSFINSFVFDGTDTVIDTIFDTSDYVKKRKNVEIFKSIDSDITFDKISSIKTLPPQHFYDLSIEGTRNFIANDIIAHNTYLATSSGNVGIGTTTPQNKLEVIGATTLAGGVNASSLNVTGFSITDDSLVTVIEFENISSSEKISSDLIGVIVMPELVKNDSVVFDLEHQDKASNMNSLVLAKASPEILEMLDRSAIETGQSD